MYIILIYHRCYKKNEKEITDRVKSDYSRK